MPSAVVSMSAGTIWPNCLAHFYLVPTCSAFEEYVPAIILQKLIYFNYFAKGILFYSSTNLFKIEYIKNYLPDLDKLDLFEKYRSNYIGIAFFQNYQM